MNLLISIFYILILGIAITGGKFVRYSILGIPVIYYCMGALVVAYIPYLIKHRKELRLYKSERNLIAFVMYGLFIALLSFLGVNEKLVQCRLLVTRAYIPRQAYYLFLLPAVLVFSETRLYEKAQYFFRKYRLELFWGIYFLRFLYARQISLSVTTVFFLAYISLQGTSRFRYEYIMLAAILFTPVATGGEITNLIIRLLYLLYYVVRNKKIVITQLIVFGFSVMIAAMFVLPFFDSQFSNLLDVNSYWRLRYWHDELLQLVDSHFLGVGYGTAYATINFVGNTTNITSGPFSATKEYTTMDLLFVTGSHNSLISVSFRLGVIGIALFLSMLWMFYKEMRRNINSISKSSLFAFFSSIVVISVNVGLESPYYLFLFLFALICCDAEIKKSHQIVLRNYDQQSGE